MFSQDLAIVDVTVVDTQTGALAPHRTVVVRDGRITPSTAAPHPRTLASCTGRASF